MTAAAVAAALDALKKEADVLAKQASQAPPRAEMMQRLEAAQAQYDSAKAAAEDFELIASRGKALQALQLEASKLPLSGEDYLTLGERHAQLVQRMLATCKQLARSKEFAALTALDKQVKLFCALTLPKCATGPPKKKSSGKSGSRSTVNSFLCLAAYIWLYCAPQ
jgi:hypothetical protein